MKDAKFRVAIALLLLTVVTVGSHAEPAFRTATPATESRLRDRDEPPTLFWLLKRLAKRFGIIKATEDMPIPPRP